MSHLVNRLASGDVLTCNYTVNRYAFTMSYNHDHGTYPSWSILVKNIPSPATRHKMHAERILRGIFGDFPAIFAIV
jgi:hypothetical protein